MENRLEYRMYGLVPYNLSPIQQGIQFGHAVVEYMLNFPPDLRIYADTKQWAEEDKTFIILNGGTTNSTPMNYGTLNKHYETLRALDVKTAIFKEPDLGDQLTAVVFLLDERVWDEEKYPSPENDTSWIGRKNYDNRIEKMGGENNFYLRQFIKQFRLA